MSVEIETALLVNIYNQGYKAGHNDIVESIYVDIVESEMHCYHEEEVVEFLKELGLL